MEVVELSIPGVKLFTPRKHGDARGFFSETYSRPEFARAGVDVEFVQDNHSLSAERHTVRGLHYQTTPFEQAKLVRVLRGRIFDVAVDIRRASPTYGRWVGAEISADRWNQIFVPVGFAHGFCTLEPATEVVYKVSAPYAPNHDRALRWDDPTLAVEWPVDRDGAVLSDKDRQAPLFEGFESPFEYD
jgi:dTDP-4-dehydrorhamnose 3,5-epimerase